MRWHYHANIPYIVSKKMRSLLVVFLLCSSFLLSAQNNWLTRLHDAHQDYQVSEIEDRRFKHDHITALVGQLGDEFKVKVEGQSVEGRSIHTVRYGSGATQVLLWSQMHGDEPTATAAVMDIFRFLAASDDGFDDFRRTLRDRLTLVFIPMLNPDGAEDFERRNALGVDLNRDALRLSTPEAQLLKRVRDEVDADWGFNLHDQSRYYGAGYPTEHMATLSFLAPAYDFRRSVNSTRERAMQVIAELNAGLQKHMSGKVARYSDAFEPRAFGDNMQLWGTSTILIESGGYPGDREKQYIRKMNFASILSACHSIASRSYQSFSQADYNKIPYNRGGVYNDLLLREVKYQHSDGNGYLLDIAFDLQEREYLGARHFYFRGAVDDIGDLSYQRGYSELAGSGYTAEIAKAFPELVPNLAAVKEMDQMALLKAGYAVVKVQKPGRPWEQAEQDVLVVGAEGIYDRELAVGLNPPLILRDASGVVKYAVVNGRLISVE